MASFHRPNLQETIKLEGPIQEITQLLNMPFLKDYPLDPDRLECFFTRIAALEAPVFPRCFEAVLLRPEHLGLNSWSFRIKKGWNQLFDRTVSACFYHVFCGLLIFQAQPFLSAMRWRLGGKIYADEDAEVYSGNRVPYFVPCSLKMADVDSWVTLSLLFRESGVVRIIPVGVTITRKGGLGSFDSDVNEAVPLEHVVTCPKCKTKIPVTEDQISQRVKALIDVIEA